MSTKMENSRIDKAIKRSKEKEEITVAIIQYNKVFGRLSDEIKKAIITIQNSGEKFSSQNALQSRIKLVERVMLSTLKFIDQNKLQFYMIDENTLGNDK